MILGALLDLGLDIKFLEKELQKLKLKDYKIAAKKVVKNGITATKFDLVEKQGKNKKHNHKNLNEIVRIINHSRLDMDIGYKIKKIFQKIATAEAKVHNKSIQDIHFHEIGALDTIIDIAGAVIGFKKLGIEKIYASKLNVGSGFVKFSHGKWPVPAPATAEMLKNIPIYNNKTEFELVTPTGAAIISTLAEKFGEIPPMDLEKTGYGSGTKDLEQPNVLRVFLGEEIEADDATINVIETNIDNMNPEIFPYVIEKLMQNGALDAYLTSIVMKKNRAAIKITVLSKVDDTDKLSKILFEETTTLGVRIFPATRKTLEREIKEISTLHGKVRYKVSKFRNKVKNISPEYEDLVKIARKRKIPLRRVYEEN